MSTFSWSYFAGFVVVMLVLYWLGFAVAGWLAPTLGRFESLRKTLRHDGPAARLFAVLLGALTPFCSCSTVPVFAGLLRAGIRPGLALTFLIASPTLSPAALFLMLTLMGAKPTLLYATLSTLTALAGGVLLADRSLATVTSETPPLDVPLRFSLREVNRQFAADLRRIGTMVVIAAFAATALRTWLPSPELLASVVDNRWTAIPLTVALGELVYADLTLLIPIAHELTNKGLDAGLVIGFLMAGSGAGVPSFLLLAPVLRWRLLVRYGVVLYGLFAAAALAASLVMAR